LFGFLKKFTAALPWYITGFMQRHCGLKTHLEPVCLMLIERMLDLSESAQQ